MIIITLITNLFKNQNIHTSIFSSAFTEAVKDTFKEMGTVFNKDGEKRKKENDSERSFLSNLSIGKKSKAMDQKISKEAR
ncbi:MAG TPA: hypothetical protein VGQ09_15265 [Chitinophagaceae bacterium]|jgi:hypothetical protein|nr:hypothetical protein [Chitinophagaceae bacterium]